jgi:hypothetical protein
VVKWHTQRYAGYWYFWGVDMKSINWNRDNLEPAGRNNSTHIVRFGADSLMPFFMRTFYRTLDEHSRTGSACLRAQDFFNFHIGQVIVNTVGAKEDAVARRDSNLASMNHWLYWPT